MELNTGILAAGGIFAVVASCWRQFKMLGTKLTRLLVVRAELKGGVLKDAFLSYARTHGKIYTAGDNLFQAYYEFVGKHDKTLPVTVQLYDRDPAVIYLNGQWLLYIGPSSEKQKDHPGQPSASEDPSAHVYTWRCRARWDDILSKAVDYRQQVLERTRQDDVDGNLGAFSNRKYAVHRSFGSRGRKSGDPVKISTSGLGRGFDYMSTLIRLGGARMVGDMTYADIIATNKATGRPFDSRPYPPEVMRLVEEVRHWMTDKEWFKMRGLPWHMGILLHGKPGNGKSEFIECLARELDMPIYMPALATMTDEDFHNARKEAEERSPAIFLMEDFDRVFKQDQNITEKVGTDQGVSYATILNAIAGVRHEGGILDIITVNNMEDMDAAIIRPGRIDVHLPMHGPDAAARHQIASLIMQGQPEEAIDDMVRASDGSTYAEFTNYCRESAYEFYVSQKRHPAKV